MSSVSLRFRFRRSLGRGASLAALGLLTGVSQARAQAPFLDSGIYGGVPQISASPVKYASVRLTRASVTPAATSAHYKFSLTLPLNGQQNYSFYYEPFLPILAAASASSAGSLFSPLPPEPPFGPSGFLPEGTYAVSYLDAAGNGKAAGTVTYKPNAGYTNSVEVPNNPPNFGPTAQAPAPLGIQGTATITFGPVSETIQGHPLQGVTVQLLSAATGQLLATVPTNGAGFYSFYYTYGSKPGFIPPGKYLVRASFVRQTITNAVTYSPDSDPASPGYYVTGAHVVADFPFAQP